jgi:hypothetical protein
MRVLLFCTLVAATLSAADVRGIWRGTITTEMAQATGGEIPAYMALEQTGNTVTGSAGGNEKMVFPITEGRTEGDRVFVQASPKEGTVLRFTLTLKGDTLQGEVEENSRKIGTARLKKER